MKLLKNISLVYTLQILAVLILFFYPNYTTQAGLTEPTINTAVKKNNVQFAAHTKISSPHAAVALANINSINPLWLTQDKKIIPRNVFNTKGNDAEGKLKKEYRIDLLFLNQSSFKNFKIADKAVNRIYK